MNYTPKPKIISATLLCSMLLLNGVCYSSNEVSSRDEQEESQEPSSLQTNLVAGGISLMYAVLLSLGGLAEAASNQQIETNEVVLPEAPQHVVSNYLELVDGIEELFTQPQDADNMSYLTILHECYDVLLDLPTSEATKEDKKEAITYFTQIMCYLFTRCLNAPGFKSEHVYQALMHSLLCNITQLETAIGNAHLLRAISVLIDPAHNNNVNTDIELPADNECWDTLEASLKTIAAHIAETAQ